MPLPLLNFLGSQGVDEAHDHVHVELQRVRVDEKDCEGVEELIEYAKEVAHAWQVFGPVDGDVQGVSEARER